MEKIRTGINHPDRIPSYLMHQLDRGIIIVGNYIGDSTKTLEINGYSATFMADTVANVRYLNEFPEQDVLSDFLPCLSPEDVLWDVGANIGLYSCFAGNLGMEVVSFEPDNPTRSSLEDNVDLNDINATVLPYGLDDKSREIERELNMQRENKPTTVETYSGDQILESKDIDIPSPTVIKVDIEGMEFSALRGLEKALEEVRLMFVELHPEYLLERGKSAEDVRQWIYERGFEIYTINDESHNPIIRCEK